MIFPINIVRKKQLIVLSESKEIFLIKQQFNESVIHLNVSCNLFVPLNVINE